MSQPGPAEEPLSARSLVEIEKICAEFERQLQANENPTLEAALSKARPELTRAAFAELLSVEIELRKLTEVDVAEYRLRFPQFETIVDQRFQRIARHPLTRRSADEPGVAPKPIVKVLPAGTKIENFELVRLLGQGTQGTVYEARDFILGRSVALKISHLATNSTEVPEQFREEGPLLAKLEHPHIVPVLQASIWQGRFYLVSRLINGKSLADRFQKKPGPLPITEALEIAIGMAQALAAAHAQKIIHRDVKPGNILIDADGRALLSDFGVALSRANFTLAAEFAGTIVYASPEQLDLRAGHVNGQSDIFSLGVVLYEMLTGHRPYQSEQLAKLKHEMLHATITPVRQLNPAVSRELEKICLQCLAINPNERFSSAAELATRLQQVHSSLNTKANWLMPALLGLLVLIALAAWFVGVWSNRPTSQPIHVDAAELHVQRGENGEVIDRRTLILDGREQMDRPVAPLEQGDRFVLSYQLSQPIPWVLVHVDPQGGAVVIARSETAMDDVRIPTTTGKGNAFRRNDPKGDNLLLLLGCDVEKKLDEVQIARDVASARTTLQALATDRVVLRAGVDEQDAAIQLPQDVIKTIQQRLPKGITPLHALYLKTKS